MEREEEGKKEEEGKFTGVIKSLCISLKEQRYKLFMGQ